MIDADCRMTFAYVMNKMAPGMVGAIAWALVERAYDIVNRRDPLAGPGVS
jgi:hypothetical protein